MGSAERQWIPGMHGYAAMRDALAARHPPRSTACLSASDMCGWTDDMLGNPLGRVRRMFYRAYKKKYEYYSKSPKTNRTL